MKLVFGLGNPGEKYARSWHNAGFMAVDALARKLGVQLTQRVNYGLGATVQVGGHKVMLVQPQTFMNRSGQCVQSLAAYYKVAAEDILVVYDDIDLPLGTVRMRKLGGPGTHNGMRDIVDQLQSTAFARVRIGVGPPPSQWDLADYVLSRPQGEQQALLDQAVDKAAQTLLLALNEDLDTAMRFANAKPAATEQSD